MPGNQRIQIHQQNTGIVMTEKPYPAPDGSLKVIDAQGGHNAVKSIRFLMRPDAAARLFKSISWGARPKRQDVEQAGVLVGKYYMDTSHSEPVIWGEVTAIIPFDPDMVKASRSGIVIPQNAWARMYDEYVPYLDKGLLNLGWYHTHLDVANARFSSTDMETQRRYYTGEYSFAVVLNPNKKRWSVYYGPEARECIGEIFIGKEIFERYCEPKITIQDVSGDSRLNMDGTITHFNPDGTPETAPTAPVSVTEPVKALHGIAKRIGKTCSHFFGSQSDDNANDLNRSGGIPGTQCSRTEKRNKNLPMQTPKITVQENEKPKITILSKEEQCKGQVVQAEVFVVSADEPVHPKQQNAEELQVIEQNMIEVVDSIIRDNANSSLNLEYQVNAQIILNNDLTLEVVSLCETKSNAVIKISTQPFEFAFPKDTIEFEVVGRAEIVNRKGSEPFYLLYVSKTTENIRLNVFQIKKEGVEWAYRRLR